MSRIPLTDRPHALLVDATFATRGTVITAAYAVLILAADERAEEPVEPAATRPGLARCLPCNVIPLRRSEVA